MKMSSIRRALVSATVIAMLAGCSGSSAFGPSQATPPSGHESGLTPLSVFRLAALTMRHYDARPQHPDHGKSWMSPAAMKSELLYVSDWATDDVYVYNYRTGALVGTLTGFESPYGQCVDRNGDVWITEFEGAEVDEYAHGSTTRINSFSTNGYAIGCAVAPNGDLAVSNFETSPSGTGDVQVFRKAAWPPKSFSNTTCDVLWAPGYLPNGHLYVGSETPGGGPIICELAASKLHPIDPAWNMSLTMPGGVQWDGKYLTVTDQDYESLDETAIYQAVETTGPSGTLTGVGTTVLTDTCKGDEVDLAQPFIVGKLNTPGNKTQGTAVVGGNLWCSSRVNDWSYPAGGNPTSSLNSAPEQPYGQSVSIVTQSN